MTARRVFPDFPGHFDGDPIVPGAALLAWVQEEVPDLAEIEHARFSAPLRPGEAASLEITGSGEALRFTVHGPRGLCARGTGRRAVGPR